MTVFLVRHAVAGSRARWLGDDRLRTLTRDGRYQAADLVDTLVAPIRHSGRPSPVGVVLSSPYRRCVETVAPLAAALGVSVVTTESLAEQMEDDALQLIRRMWHYDVVLCSHGDIIPFVLEQLHRHDGLDLGPAPKCQKGSVWILDTDTPTDGSTGGLIEPEIVASTQMSMQIFSHATYVAPPRRTI